MRADDDGSVTGFESHVESVARVDCCFLSIVFHFCVATTMSQVLVVLCAVHAIMVRVDDSASDADSALLVPTAEAFQVCWTARMS